MSNLVTNMFNPATAGGAAPTAATTTAPAEGVPAPGFDSILNS